MPKTTTKSVVMAIDPGVPMGYAVWPLKRWKRSERTACRPDAPEWTGVLGSKLKAMPYHVRAIDMAFHLRLLCDEQAWLPLLTFVEWPQDFQSSAGRTASRSGSIVKLSVATGCLMHEMGRLGGTVRHVPVVDWKGQLSKAQVESRIRRKLGAAACENYDSHVWDAVGIGLFGMGVF